MLSKLSNEERSYLIGLWQGDGSLSEQTRNRGKLAYEISNKDRDIIGKIASLLSPYVKVNIRERTRDTNFKKNYKSISLVIHDMFFRKEIKKYFPVGKKSTIVSPPDNILVRDYIRGFIDSDGSLGLTSNGRCFLSLCTSSEDIKQFVLKNINQKLGLVKKINRNKRDGVYNIVIYDEDAQKYSDYLYKGSSLFIDRKYNKYIDVMAWVRSGTKKRKKRVAWDKTEDKIVLQSDLSWVEKSRLLNRTLASIKGRHFRLSKFKKE